MTYQEAIQYLSQAYRLNQQIKSKTNRIKQLDELATNITSTISCDKVQSSCSNSAKHTEATDKIIDLARTLERDKLDLIQCICSIEQDIDSVTAQNARYGLTLSLRYLEYLKFEAVAERLECDLRHAYRLHGKAVNLFCKNKKCH